MFYSACVCVCVCVCTLGFKLSSIANVGAQTFLGAAGLTKTDPSDGENVPHEQNAVHSYK